MTVASSSSIAIIGGGAAGSLLALHLAKHHGLRVTLYDGSGAFGRGVAYSATSPWHRLNVPAIKMGGWHADDPGALLQWLAGRDGGTPDSHSSRYLERSVYGEWLSAQLLQAVATGDIRVVPLNVLALQPVPSTQRAQWQLHLADGQRHEAHAVVLCQGISAPRSLPGLPEHERYLSDPWRAKALARIDRDDTVLVAGSGASGIDTVLELLNTGHRGRIHLVSRRALLPRPDVLPLPDAVLRGPVFELSASKRTPLRLMYTAVRHAIKLAQDSGQPWQLTMDAVLRQADPLWEHLTLADQQRFLRHVRPYWMVFRHRADPAVLDRVQAAQAAGQLQRTAARIDAVDELEYGLRVSLRHAGQPVPSINTGWLINATGPEERISRRADPLIAKLLQDGFARPGKLGLGLDVTAEGEVLKNSRGATPPLYAMGLPTRGVYWEVTSVPALRARAAPLAARLASQFGDATWQGHHPTI